MACLNLFGFETGDSVEAQATAGTFSIQTSVKRSGAYALRVNPTTTATGEFRVASRGADGTNANYSVATAYATFYFRYATKPAANSEEIARFTHASGLKAAIRINSSGNLMLFAADGTTQLGSTGSVALSADTWYRLHARCATGASAEAAVEIYDENGTTALETVSGTGNISTNNNARLALGKVSNRNSQSVDFFYDDVHIDDSAFKGKHRVVKISPDANGSTMSWNGGTNASDYQEVDETPEDAADYVMSPASGAPNVALFDFATAASASISGTINAVKLVTRSREDATVASANLLRIRSGSTNSDSSTFNATTTVATRERLLETDPDTSAAWTTGGIDAIEGGMVENNNVAVRMTALWFMVSYTEAAGGASSMLLQIMHNH